MDASRDPRRKRVSSRSPEGAQARKQLKPGQPYENTRVQGNDSGTRRPSLPNGTSLQPNGLASYFHHRTSVQLSKESNKETGGMSVNSPNARDSVNGDTSGRSTPQQKAKNGSISNDKASTMDAATDITFSAKGGSTDPQSIFKLLTNISSHCATQASLQIARDQAEVRANRLQLEYNANRRQFGEFPAIRERKTADKEAAQEELADVERRLKEHTASQAQYMTTLANIIGQAAEGTSRTDQISRAEYDALSRKCTDLRQGLDIAVKLVENQRAQLVETKAVAESANTAAGEVANVQDYIRKLEQEIDAFKQWKSVSDTTLREVKNYKDAVKTAQGAADHTRKQLDQIQSEVQQYQRGAETTRSQMVQLKNDMKKFPTSESMDKLASHYETLDQEVAGVKRKSSELQKDLGQLRASKVLSSVAQAHTKAGSASPNEEDKQSNEHLAKFSKQGPALFTKVDTLERSVNEISDRLNEKAELVENQLKQIWVSIREIEEDVYEEGKPPAVKRIKNLDNLVNNLSTKIQLIEPDEKPSMQQRLSQIEQDQLAVQKDLKHLTLLPDRLEKVENSNEAVARGLKSLQSNEQPQQASNNALSSTVDLTPIYARFDHLDKEMAEAEQQATEKDAITAKWVEGWIAAVRGEFANSEKGRTEEIKSLKTSLSVLQQKVATLDSALVSKADSGELTSLQAVLRGKVMELEEDIKKLQAQPQKATPGPQTPALPSSDHLQYGAPMPNGGLHSPQLQNSVNGSVSIQNGTVPRLSTPHGNTVAVSLPNQVQEIRRISTELERFVGVTQQLKQRFDNLQTDDMVRQMIDQMNQMYPHAKNVEHAINALRTDLAKLRSEKDTALKDLNNWLSETKKLSTSATAKAEHAAKHADSIDTEVRRMSTEFEDVKIALDRVTDLTKEAAVQSEHIPSITESFQEAKSEFETQLKTMTTEMMTTKTGMKVLDDRIVTCEGKIEGMDKLLKKKQ